MTPREELQALRRLAELEAKARGVKPQAEEKYDPTAGMSATEKFLAGTGKAFVDTARGLGQITGLVSRDEVDEAKRRDAPLMDSGWAMGGNVVGNLATMVGPGAAVGAAGKAAKVPAMVNAARAFLMPKTVAGAGAAGAAMGAIQPVASDDSRALNIGLGAVGGAAVPAAITGGRLAKDIVAPFTQGGREKLAGRVLERFAKDPDSILRGGKELVPGSIPTLAEATQDIGLAQLQRSLRNNPDANMAITNRMLANQDARLNALREIAGDDGKREFFVGARDAAAKDLYAKAFAEEPTITPWIKGELTKLMQRPSLRDVHHGESAWTIAKKLAAEEGVKLQSKNSVQIMHYTKMALDDMISKAADSPKKQAALKGTRDKLVSLMESKDFAPSYREARETFAAMSKPVNQMDLGQRLLNDLQPALSEFGAVVRATPQKYASSVRNLDQTAKQATGFRGARADKILEPGQRETVENVARDLGRSANAQELGMARGSPTAQNLVGQDILRQVLGPLGLPKGVADTALADFAARPVSWAYKPVEQRVLGLLGDAAVDPKEAKRLLELARKRGLFNADKLIPYSSSLGTAGLLGLSE